MRYAIDYTSKFKQDLRRCRWRGLDMMLIFTAIEILEKTGHLPLKYRPHRLSGKYKGCRECHIQADWLLVWRQDDDSLVLLMTDTGTHADLFGR